MRYLTPALVVALILVGCLAMHSNMTNTSPNASDATSPLAGFASPLSNLAMPHAGRAMHEGSWDRTGADEDLRSVDPGQTITLLDYKGAGVIHRFWMTMSPRSEVHIHRQAILRMYWDDDVNPSVECPIGDFFGVGFGEQKDYISLPLNETSGGYNCYWPMPFHKSARWTLTNLGQQRVDTFYYNIDFTGLDTLPADVRHFRAQWRRENPTSRDKNYTILDTVGQGHFVGCALFMQGWRPNNFYFLEGDEMVYIDGEAKPSIIGTGTEDYFGSGRYFDRGLYSAPYHGLVLMDKPHSRVSAYRWHIEDAMPYAKSLRVTIEHGSQNHERADYSSVAYYYETGPANPPPPLPKNPKDLLPVDTIEKFNVKDAIEGESLVPTATATSGTIEVQGMQKLCGDFSGSAQLLWRPEKAGETLTLKLPVPTAGEYEVIGRFASSPDYGKIEVTIGKEKPKALDLDGDEINASGPISLGHAKLQAGDNIIKITTTGKNPRSGHSFVGLDAIELKPIK